MLWWTDSWNSSTELNFHIFGVQHPGFQLFLSCCTFLLKQIPQCPLSSHDCCMATIGTTPARQVWQMFQTLVPSPCKNSTWKFTKIRTSRGIIDELMKDYLFFPTGIRIMETCLMPATKGYVSWKEPEWGFYAALCSGKITVFLVNGAAQSSDKLYQKLQFLHLEIWLQHMSELFLFNWLRY